MKTLLFRTNIDCPSRLAKASYGLDDLRGRYNRYSVDLLEADHLLTIHTESLQSQDIIQAMQKKGITCKEFRPVKNMNQYANV